MRHAALVVFRRDDPHLVRQFGCDRFQDRQARRIDAIVVGQQYSVQHAPAPLHRSHLFDASGPPRPAWPQTGRRRTMQIIDAQVHIWGSGTAERPSSADLDLHGRGADQGDGRGRREWRGAASAELGQRLERDGGGSREEIPRQVLHPWLVPARPPRRAQAHRDLEAAARHAGSALVADAAGAGELAQGRHDGLAVAGGGTCRHADRDDGLALPAAVQADRRAASAI